MPTDWSLTKKSIDVATAERDRLQAERDKGLQMLQAAQQQAAALQQNILRIEGAITIIDQMLNGDGPAAED